MYGKQAFVHKYFSNVWLSELNKDENTNITRYLIENIIKTGRIDMETDHKPYYG